ncbi:MAG: caspase family protein [Crocinitomicaceae bacterium]|nr:caspase family protein [Crocinitomicaceae bacterium]
MIVRYLFIFILLTALQVLANLKPEVVLTTGHADQINYMVISPNGKYLASAGNNKVVKIWDIATTREYRTISGMDGRIDQMIFAHDNIHLAAVTQQNEVIVWNVVTGKEVFKTRQGGLMNGIALSKDGKRLFHSSDRSFLGITDMETGKTREVEVVSMSLTVDTNKNMIYTYDQLGNLNYFSIESEAIVKTVKLFDELNYPFSRSDLTPDGRYMATGFNDDILRVYDTEQHKFVFESPKYNAKIKDLKFDPKASYLYISLTDGRVQVIDYKRFEVKKEFNESMFVTQCLTSHPKGEIIIMANNDIIRFYNVKQGKTFKELGGKVSKIVKMAYDPNGDYLAVASDNITIELWDLKLNKRISTLAGFFPCQFTLDGKHLITQLSTINMGVWNVETGQLEGELPTYYMMQQSVTISPDGNYVAGGGMDMNVRIWDLKSKTLISTIGPNTGLVTGVDIHPTESWIAVTTYGTSNLEDPTVKVWDFKSNKLIREFNDQIICASDVKFSPDGKFMATSAWDKTIIIREVENWTIKQKLIGHTNNITSIDFNAEGTILASGASNNAVSEFDNSVRFWEVQSGKEICKIQAHDNGITQVIFDQTNDRVFSSSEDGTIKINDYKKCEVIATYVAITGGDFMIYTPDNFYMASKNALKEIAFRINNELVPFEQFDVYLNRPDIVAERIGKSPPQLIKAYNYLHQKRLRKLNLDEGELQLDYHLPNIMNETNVDLVTTDKNLKVWVKAWDDSYNIEQLNIFVNDVPIFGEQGYRPDAKVKSIRKEFEIPLVFGENRIQLSCINDNGAESLYETIEIIRQGDEEKHDLYIVAIGVSKYQDDRFNLTYPTKDATDVVAKLKESGGMYNQIHSKMLLNEDATSQNFEDLREFFKGSTHEDLAIIFIAGHGVLNTNFDYFYGTYDMDFNAPEEKGLSYDRIHAMLNELKPYRKLLIMDTCHSGELDKEEIEEGPAPEVEDGEVEFRAAGVGVRQKQGFGFENTVEFMQDVFSDTRKGSGATVISSAGGAEYAMESDQWKNGLFTYAFLSGLDNPATDKNKDQLIQVSEIRSFVHKQVEKLSHGKQIPSSREENISQDYIIFGH